jgi:O-antigen/teichoic acid export membrane protein
VHRDVRTLNPLPQGARLLGNTLSAVGGRAIVTALGVVTFAILARTVGAHGLGQYRTVFTLVLIAGTFFDLGLATLSLRAMSTAAAPRMLGVIIGLRMVASAFAMLLLVLACALFERDPVIRLGVLIVGVGWIGLQVSEVLRAVFQQQLAENDAALAELAGALLTLGLVATCANMGWGTDAMLAAGAAGLLATAALGWRLAQRRVAFRVRIDLQAWRGLLAAGVPFGLSAILLSIHFRVDVLLLSFLRTSADVGLYDAPTKLYEMVFMACYLFAGALLPLFARDLASRGGALQRRLQGAFTAVLAASALAGAVLFIEGERIVVLLGGEQFRPSGRPLRVLAIAVVFAGACAVARHALTAMNRQQHMLRADLISVAGAVAVHLALIPRYGVMGAAMGRLTGDALRMLLTMRLLHGQSGSPWMPLLAGAASALLAGSILLLCRWIGLHWMVACVISGVVSPLLVLAVPRVRQEMRNLASG